jgi:hypothetical protein
MLQHPALISREEEVVSLFAKFKECSDKGEYVAFKDWSAYVNNAADYYYKDKDDKNKYKGDMFEVFTEIYFKLINSKNSSGVFDYSPLHGGDVDDMGVDGMGTNYQGNPCVVQVKYRSNPTSSIEYSALANTWTQAYTQEMVAETYDKQSRSIILFTNCKGANDNSHKILGKRNRLFVINNDIIEMEVDGNVIFWQHALQLIKDTVNK